MGIVPEAGVGTESEREIGRSVRSAVPFLAED